MSKAAAAYRDAKAQKGGHGCDPDEFLEPSLPNGTAVQERSSREFGGETWVFVDGPGVSGWVRDCNLLPVGGANARRERAAHDPATAGTNENGNETRSMWASGNLIDTTP